MLPFFASGELDFRFQDYFRLVVRCIVYRCAWHSSSMNLAHIIQPKLQQGVGDTLAAGSICASRSASIDQPLWKMQNQSSEFSESI